jgi:hypothetical protein
MEEGKDSVALSGEERRSLELLRTKGLSIKNLDDETRAELRKFLSRIHHEKGLSLSDIAKLIGNKTSGYTSWLYRSLGVPVRPFEESRLKAIREKRRKYERRPFEGSAEDRAYMLGLRHGDLSVSRPWNGVVRVSTSTTHPAMAELFHTLFGKYGHVYQHPRYKKDTESYEWNLSALLDDTFDFLLLTKAQGWALATRSHSTLAYLAGFFDAEGSIGICRNANAVAIVLAYYNTDLALLRRVRKGLVGLGYHPLRPYLDKKKGFRSPGYHIEMKKDYFRVLVARFDEAQAILRILPIRHPEKLAKKKLALSIERGTDWHRVSSRLATLRARVLDQRNRFVGEAERKLRENR